MWFIIRLVNGFGQFAKSLKNLERDRFHDCTIIQGLHILYECVVLQVLSFKLNVGHFPHLADLVTRINYNNYYVS